VNEPLEAPEGHHWSVIYTDFDGTTIGVSLRPEEGDKVGKGITWSVPLTPWVLAKQERIEKKIRACKRAILRKYAENQRIEAAINAS